LKWRYLPSTAVGLQISILMTELDFEAMAPKKLLRNISNCEKEAIKAHISFFGF